MKRIMLKLSVIAIFLVMLVNMAYASIPTDKATGGGWISDYSGNGKDRFGFVACWDKTGEARGQFEFHGYDGINLHSVELWFVNINVLPECNEVSFSGTCTVNGESGYVFGVLLEDGGPGSDSHFSLAIQGPDGFNVGYYGIMDGGGHIRVHSAS